MEQFNVTGMSCAACSARVEKAVSALEGVSACSVSLLTNSMGVEGTAAPEAVIAAVKAAGYGASQKNSAASAADRDNDALKDTQTPLIKKRLVASLILLAPLMYVSMGHTMWNWPLPPFLAENNVALALTQLLLTTAIMVVNQRFFASGFKGIAHGAPNMDSLVALGASASYVYSVFVLYIMISAPIRQSAEHLHGLYFESAAMILTLITVGKMLEARSKGRTTDALKSLMRLMPKTAVVLRGDKETEIPISQVKKGDRFVVRPGENIPVDGIVIDGSGAVNEAALTGESVPVDKAAGDSVSASTLNQSGFLTCEATRVGEDTTLAQIIRMVSDAAATKAPIARIADKVSGIFVPVVITIAAVSFAAWLAAGESAGYALSRGISVLVISCPCALGLATPVAIMVGSGMGAKSGILFKTAASIEQTGKADIVVLDKTGTLTRGEPMVTDIYPADGVTEQRLLEMAYALEQKSEHPLAKAVVQEAEKRKIDRVNAEDFAAVSGNGLTGTINGSTVAGGSLKYISQLVSVNAQLRLAAENYSKEGKTPLFFCAGSALLGIIAVADVLKDDSPSAVKELRSMGLKVIMLTGDNQQTAAAIGSRAGVDEVIAGVLPDGKEAAVRRLQEKGKVVMVGDGINDAPALTRADIGIAIGAGTDVAIDAADVVLIKSRLSDVPAAIRLSRATLKNIHENLFWAFFYNTVGIPLATGVWIPLFGWKLSPMFAAAAMSLSSFCVVMNALRLNLFNMYDGSRDKKQRAVRQKKKSGKTITLTVSGMMCPHCEASVKSALEAIDGVEEASADFKTGAVTLDVSKAVPKETMRKAIEAAGYELKAI